MIVDGPLRRGQIMFALDFRFMRGRYQRWAHCHVGLTEPLDTNELGFQPLAYLVHRSAANVESCKEHKKAVDGACVS